MQKGVLELLLSSDSQRPWSVVEIERERDKHIRDIGQRLVAEHGEALEILANHDPDAPRQ